MRYLLLLFTLQPSYERHIQLPFSIIGQRQPCGCVVSFVLFTFAAPHTVTAISRTSLFDNEASSGSCMYTRNISHFLASLLAVTQCFIPWPYLYIITTVLYRWRPQHRPNLAPIKSEGLTINAGLLKERCDKMCL